MGGVFGRFGPFWAESKIADRHDLPEIALFGPFFGVMVDAWGANGETFGRPPDGF